MALIPPFFLDCVLAIGFRPPGSDAVHYQATGFLYGHPIGKDNQGEMLYRIYVITNRHVFEGEAKTFLRFNPRDTTPARVYDLDLRTVGGQPLWTPHPSPEIDIAVQSINVGLLDREGIQYAFFVEEEHVLTNHRAAEMGLAEGDDVYVLGFPMGQVGENRNYVIVRGGVVARVRDALAGAALDFLVDVTIFPGNSGGPVVTRPQMMSITGTKSIGSAYLIGVVSSYVPYQDVAISQQTKRTRIVFEENSGLAAVVPMDRVLEAIDAAEQRLNVAAPPTEN